MLSQSCIYRVYLNVIVLSVGAGCFCTSDGDEPGHHPYFLTHAAPCNSSLDQPTDKTCLVLATAQGNLPAWLRLWRPEQGERTDMQNLVRTATLWIVLISIHSETFFFRLETQDTASTD